MKKIKVNEDNLEFTGKWRGGGVGVSDLVKKGSRGSLHSEEVSAGAARRGWRVGNDGVDGVRAAARGVVVSAERSGELRWSATCGKQTGKKEGLEDVPRHGEEDRA